MTPAYKRNPNTHVFAFQANDSVSKSSSKHFSSNYFYFMLTRNVFIHLLVSPPPVSPRERAMRVQKHVLAGYHFINCFLWARSTVYIFLC